MAMYEKDQDTVKLVASLNPASKRHGGVWGEKRVEPLPVQKPLAEETSPPPTSRISPVRLDEIKFKRREAAKWINGLINESIPHATDREFRAALRSGVILCRIMNEVAPNTIKVVHADDDVNNTKQRYENVQNFMQAAITMGVPTEYMLSCPDLESDSGDERPRVSDCILWLKRLHGGSTAASPSPMPDASTDSPRRLAHAAVTKALHRSGAPLVAGHNQPLALPRGMHTTDQINVMQGMSAMLKEKMSYQADVRSSASTTTMRHATSYGQAVDAMGPVLENVLGSITQEYERRLLSKDQEIQSVKDKLQGVQREMDMLQQAMGTLRHELETSQQQAATEHALGASERLRDCEEQIAVLERRLHEREQECTQLQRQVDQSTGAVDRLVAEKDGELALAREKLRNYQHFEESYRLIKEENRALYNQVQDLRGAIRVFCRIRPAGRTGDTSGSCIDVGSEQELATYDPRASVSSSMQGSGHLHPKNFKFDRVFGEGTTQEEIYADTQPLIRSVLDGYNVCIFAYGQTGSGKTHTMSGTDVRSHEGRGINYRALDDLFDLRNKRSDEVEYTIKLQMLEIYNESLRDLFVDSSQGGNKLEILNTQPSGCNVNGAHQADVSSTADVLEFMARGARNRHSAETKMNQRSSRSHQVLTVIVDGANKVTGVKTHGCLHLVDLAGSERTMKSEVHGDRMIEANHINSSLSALGSVMASLANKCKHIPFRDSKLTQLLADSLSGQAKVMMFMHISPESSSYQETTSTLKFAERVSAITLGEAKKNVESGEVYKSHEEITRLRRNLEHRDMELQRLQEQLRQEQRRSEDLNARMARADNGQVQDDMFSEGWQSAAGSQTVESKQHQAQSYYATPSPAPQSQPRATPPPASPYGGAVTPMPMIREDFAPSHSALPHAPQLTPTSARPSGMYGAKPSGIKPPTASARDGGKWAGGSTSTNQQQPHHLQQPTASGTSTVSRQSLRPPMPPTGIRASVDRGEVTSRAAPPAPKPTAPPRPSSAATASARPAGMWGGSKPSGLQAAPVPAPAAAAPVTAGGQRGNRWGGAVATKAATPGGGGRWRGGA